MVMISRTAAINEYCYNNKINKNTITNKVKCRPNYPQKRIV